MIHLIIGGSRSGKSRYAENLLQAMKENESQRKIFYIATATAGDEEMSLRIERHQQSRPADWSLVEEPLCLSHAINAKNQPENILLIECMTLWLCNWLTNDAVEKKDNAGWQSEKQAFLNALKQSAADIVIVTNEVGSGIVPLGELSRQFVDQAGWLNQSLAQLADKVTLVIAGCPLSLNAKQGFDELVQPNPLPDSKE